AHRGPGEHYLLADLRLSRVRARTPALGSNSSLQPILRGQPMTWQSRANRSQYFGSSERGKWAIVVVTCILVIAAAYLWIDRPVAYFVHDQLRPYRTMFDAASRLPELIGPLVVAAAVLLAIPAVIKRRLTAATTVVVLSALSLALSNVPKNW